MSVDALVRVFTAAKSITALSARRRSGHLRARATSACAAVRRRSRSASRRADEAMAGNTMLTGFEPFAKPTARTASGHFSRVARRRSSESCRPESCAARATRRSGTACRRFGRESHRWPAICLRSSVAERDGSRPARRRARAPADAVDPREFAAQALLVIFPAQRAQAAARFAHHQHPADRTRQGIDGKDQRGRGHGRTQRPAAHCRPRVPASSALSISFAATPLSSPRGAEFSHECIIRTRRNARNCAGSHAAPADLGAAARGRAGNGNPQGRARPPVGELLLGVAHRALRRCRRFAGSSRTSGAIATELGRRSL